jgi:bifunctional non-homologous end joining protein LigD
MPLPRWAAPQVAELVEKAPTGPNWMHEIKFDGHRTAERGQKQLLTHFGRLGLKGSAGWPAPAPWCNRAAARLSPVLLERRL